ncbi:MAG: hypothetical protein MUC36_03665 [Planctomycetes bacterium]|jgi:WD40 repeat protein|nr:hypothetical protein [Planctomycetota bacterium]
MQELHRHARFASTSLLFASLAIGQCTLQWSPGETPCGPDGDVLCACRWDPDGAGPQPAEVVVGGSFQAAGNAIAPNIARWDPQTGAWSTFGVGMNAEVRALAVLPTGELVAAGSFTSAGGVAVNRVARWTGSAWQPFGSGSQFPLNALAVLPNGDLVTGGTSAQVRRWTGAAWTPIGALNGSIQALIVDANGDLIAGGSMTGQVARWDGTAWITLGSGLQSSSVLTLALRPNGNLLAGGLFTLGASRGIAEWDGTSWTAFGVGVGPAFGVSVDAMHVEASGDVLVGGSFTTAGGVTARGVARWNGSAWSTIGNDYVRDLRAFVSLPNGDLLAGGRMPLRMARRIGTTWQPLPGTIDGPVHAAVDLPQGGTVFAGDFTRIGGIAANRIAIRQGGQWAPLGTGITGPVRALTRLPDGRIVAGGAFAGAGGIPVTNVASWDGSSWSAMGSLPGEALRLATRPGGDVYVASGVPFLGSNFLGAWNGSAWVPVPGGFDWVRSLAIAANGDLLVGGVAGVARWNGVSLQWLGSSPWVRAVAELTDGRIVAGKETAPWLTVWDGLGWTTPIGTAPESVEAVAPLPDGGFVACHESLQSLPMFYRSTLRRWNGATWTQLAQWRISGAPVRSITWTEPGLRALGSFGASSGVLGAGIAVLDSSCPATVATAGAGCGANTTSATRPWIGSPWRAVATGLPSSAVVAAVFGATTLTLPLANVFTTAGAGCTLRVAPEVVVSTFAVAGRAESSFALPMLPALVGVSFAHQMVFLALDPSLAIGATEANRMTLGLY